LEIINISLLGISVFELIKQNMKNLKMCSLINAGLKSLEGITLLKSVQEINLSRNNLLLSNAEMPSFSYLISQFLKVDLSSNPQFFQEGELVVININKQNLKEIILSDTNLGPS
jgi:hypothetical protein